MNYASRTLYQRNPPLEGPDVILLQKLLEEQGLAPGSPDGVFGSKTALAVKNFQRISGLRDDGLVGPETWLKLGQQPMAARFPSLKTGHTHEQPSITVDLSRRRLYFIQGKKTQSYPVAVGKPATPSPIGNWIITEKIMNPGGPFGARWMRLSVPWGGYGIHGTNNPKSIGKAVSHGCIRMYNKDIIEIYPLTPIGTTVNIVGQVETQGLLMGGSQKRSVREIQYRLRVLGFKPGPIDGYYGSKTRSAILSFQDVNRLPQSGCVDYSTLIALQKAFDNKTGNIEP